jgi:hypothetical protein
MNFLAPLFLLGALAIAGPVIFHLIRRTTKDRQKFGSLMFLDPTPPRLTKRSRIEHWLLLLLRAAALGLLALAFARPFFRTHSPIADAASAQNRTVILLDTSASMKRAGLMDAAKERARDVIESAAAEGSVALVSFDSSSTPLLTFDEWTQAAAEARSALARERLDTAQPSWSGTGSAAALMSAAELLAESASASGRREIVLITDAQEGSRLEGIQGYEWPQDVRLRIETVKPERIGNAGVQLAGESRADTDAAKGVRLRVSNSADAEIESFQLGWQAADGGFAGTAQDVYVPPGQSRIVTLPWPDGAAKSGQVLLRGDAEEFDNIVHVTPPPSVTVPVLHSGESTDPRGPLFFLEKALPASRALTATLSHHAANAVPAAEVLKSAPLWFITAPLDVPVAQAVAEWVGAGGTAFIMLHTTDMAATLGTIARSKAVPALSKTDGTSTSNHALLGTIDFTHPLFAAFAEPRFSDFTKIRFWNFIRMDPAALPDARITAKFDSGDPALLEVPRDKGRVFVLTSGWHPAASQLALSSKFPGLLASLLATTGAGAEQPAQYFAGTAEFKEPGLQQLSKDGLAREVAVNLDPSESRTTALEVEEFEKLGAPVAVAVQPAAPPDAAAESLAAAAEAEGRQKLWRWLLAAVFAVLFIETLLGIRTARHYSPVEGGTAV